MSNKLGNIRRA